MKNFITWLESHFNKPTEVVEIVQEFLSLIDPYSLIEPYSQPENREYVWIMNSLQGLLNPNSVIPSTWDRITVIADRLRILIKMLDLPREIRDRGKNLILSLEVPDEFGLRINPGQTILPRQFLTLKNYQRAEENHNDAQIKKELLSLLLTLEKKIPTSMISQLKQNIYDYNAWQIALDMLEDLGEDTLKERQLLKRVFIDTPPTHKHFDTRFDDGEDILGWH